MTVETETPVTPRSSSERLKVVLAEMGRLFSEVGLVRARVEDLELELRVKNESLQEYGEVVTEMQEELRSARAERDSALAALQACRAELEDCRAELERLRQAT